MGMAYHNELGKEGEALAVAHLESRGYEILERNFRYDRAEIDIIARLKQGEVVVVEVKTRNSSAFGDPQQFVYKSKIRQLVKAADGYLTLNSVCGKGGANNRAEADVFIFCQQLLNGRFVTVQQVDNPNGFGLDEFHVFTKEAV